MPRFVAEERKILVSTSFKVMYSSIAKSGVTYLDESAFALRMRQRRYKHVVLVRNPYTRLASFFADKLRKSVRGNSGHWQLSQQIFFPFIGVSLEDPPETVREAMLGISLERFVELIPSLRDDHLLPQSALLDVKERHLHCETQMLRMEHDLDRLWSLLGVECPPHLNKSSEQPDLLSLSAEHRSIVNDFYRTDFLSFGYRMH
jgi:hypothetical protein